MRNLIIIFCLLFSFCCQGQTTQDEQRFLEYVRVEVKQNQVQVSSFESALTWYRIAKEFIYQDWFQDTIVSFLSKRTKRDELEERLGEKILRMMEQDSSTIELTYEELIKIIE